MTIGEKIYDLRRSRGLSQERLAELMDVSRQSVSKWETDSAVPELDKLMKLCDVFNVSLDELTGRTRKTDEDKSEQEYEKHGKQDVSASSASVTQQKIIGCILLGFSLLAFLLLLLFSGDILVPSMVALPALACSIICLTVSRSAGYWCAWAVYGTFEMLLGFLTGMSAFSPMVIAVRLLASAGLAWAAWRCFGGEGAQVSRQSIYRLILCWVGFIVLATAAVAALYTIGSFSDGAVVLCLFALAGGATVARGLLYRRTARVIAGWIRKDK